jgi:very-short-patch-repair endonuclease
MANRETARELRRNQTPAERALWELLRGRQVLGLKFLRQMPANGFIADFCCREVRLVVELDGGIHETEQQAAYDDERDACLRGLGYTILRFSNREVLEEPESVLRRIGEVAEDLKATWYLPSSRRGRRTIP